MKKTLLTVLSGMLMFAGAASTPASAEDCIMLKNDETIRGTFQGYLARLTQHDLAVRTDDGRYQAHPDLFMA